MIRTTLLASPVLALFASCAHPPARREAPPTPAASAASSAVSSSAVSPAAVATEGPVVLGDVLIWPVRYGRAEDLAATLQPFFERRFGPGVRIVPHIATNRILVHVPSWREREMQRSRQTPIQAR